MQIRRFRRLTIEDACLSEYDNWSRPYEYAFVLEQLKQIPGGSIHNMCCGTQYIHMDFAVVLDGLSKNVLHSDAVASPEQSRVRRFIVHDVTKPLNETFDVVVCVSSFEDIYDSCGPKTAETTFNYMMDQVNPGGHLLLTCDYPTVPLAFLENLLGKSIQESTGEFLHSGNSVHKTTEFIHYNIIAIDICKV